MTDTNRTPMHRFFAGLTEHTFEVRMGVVDPPLVDYVSQLLVRFVHADTIYKVRQPDGRRGARRTARSARPDDGCPTSV